MPDPQEIKENELIKRANHLILGADPVFQDLGFAVGKPPYEYPLSNVLEFMYPQEDRAYALYLAVPARPFKWFLAFRDKHNMLPHKSFQERIQTQGLQDYLSCYIFDNGGTHQELLAIRGRNLEEIENKIDDLAKPSVDPTQPSLLERTQDFVLGIFRELPVFTFVRGMFHPSMENEIKAWEKKNPRNFNDLDYNDVDYMQKDTAEFERLINHPPYKAWIELFDATSDDRFASDALTYLQLLRDQSTTSKAVAETATYLIELATTNFPLLKKELVKPDNALRKVPSIPFNTQRAPS